MALPREQFADQLMREIRARRSFGGHPLWRRIEKTSLGMWWQFFDGIADEVSARHA